MDTQGEVAGRNKTRPVFMAAFIALVAIVVISSATKKTTWNSKEMLQAQGEGKSIAGTMTGTLESQGASDLVVFEQGGGMKSTGLFKIKDDAGGITFYYVLGECPLPAQTGGKVRVSFETRGIVLSQGGKPMLFFFGNKVEPANE
ncbi:MAG: hypothetical protein HY291_00090 [Planctomycetes bacterium]|nr:hypothetical protein [Planctomycetota bacterium]